MKAREGFTKNFMDPHTLRGSLPCADQLYAENATIQNGSDLKKTEERCIERVMAPGSPLNTLVLSTIFNS